MKMMFVSDSEIPINPSANYAFGPAADQTGCYCDLHAEHIVVRLCSRSDRLILHLAYGAKYVCLRILLFGSAAGQTG